ncbi:MAG: putative porin [Flavobacteriaceae bacterium]|nr:putative porin [Flavobacteriaceae bacterium]
MFSNLLFAQNDSIKSKLSFQGDVRFRIEQDWNSRKSNGTYRDHRTRLRLRARLGLTYDYKDWATFGVRLRTGDPKKQQDPHLTLGNTKEFNSLPIAFEKVYAKFKHQWFSAWIGKNSFPFEKQNELFWSDNVYPEGVSFSGLFNLKNIYIETLQINTGHFIVNSSGSSLDADAYFQGLQLVTSHWQNRLKVFPSFYYFNDIPNIPDGNETFVLDYAILHIGSKATIVTKPKINIGVDYLHNIKNYDQNNNISEEFSNQKNGIVTSLSVGDLKKSNDWKIGFTYSYIERFAAVDYFAQNDWVRWDYSSQGSNDGRLTNFKGLEIMGGYALNENMNLKIRFFTVDQLISYGNKTETGNRIRLDYNFSF